jgi:hypothetical protein
MDAVSKARGRRGLVLVATVALVGSWMVTRSYGDVHHAAATPKLSFSRMVVVNEQAPGFEPDVKVAPDGTTYTSFPFGFSTTQSFLSSSRDGGKSYQLTPGNIGPGKPATCVGGGDTDLYVDPGNAIYFSDLQGLTNISQSVSTDGGASFTTNCAGVPNTPVDRMWFTATGSLANHDLRLYEDFDQTETGGDPTDLASNQLVETVSTDGVTFLPVVNPAVAHGALDCAGTSLNCVTDNEGISGNQVVDPATGNLYLAHTTINASNGTPGVQVSEGKITAVGPPTTARWTESPNLDAALCPDPTCVDGAGNAEAIAGENFATIARDSAGYLYVVFTEGPVDTAGNLTAPEQIYVVHSLAPAGADPSRVRWSQPKAITHQGTNTFPWITAGSNGRVDVAWYHTNQTSEGGLFGAANLTNAEWNVQLGQSLHAHSGAPAYTIATVSEHAIKHGQICTNGLGCVAGGDRSLGDFLQVTTDNRGAAVLSYVDDTSADTAAGEDAGPEVISRQVGGPSLLASVGTIRGPGNGPGRALDSVSDPRGDADYSANGTRTAAGANLDVVGASLVDEKEPSEALTVTIKVKSLADLSVSPALGGPDASWIVRWTRVMPGTTGNGHIFYAGMDNNASGGGTPTFFAGDTSCIPGPGNPAEHCKYLTYPQTTVLSASQASYNPTTGVITMHVPETAVGPPEPAGRATLYSVTAFSATSTVPQSATTLFNVIDSTVPFDVQGVH